MLEAQLLAIRTTRALWHSNVLTVAKIMHSITKSAVFIINESMIFNILKYQIVFIFFEARNVYQQSHGQKVMNYAGAIKVLVQSTLICTQTDVSWIGSEPVLGSTVLLLLLFAGQYHPSHDQWVLPLGVADEKKTVAPARSSPPKKG